MKKLTQEEFIQKACEVHGHKYDYSKVEYVDTRTKITIICPEHGEFVMKPNNHVSQRQGCKKCGYERVSKSKKVSYDNFLEKAETKHNGKYSYIEDTFVGMHEDMTMVCPRHGYFKLSPTSHLRGVGCPYCAGNKKLTTEQFIEKAYKIHGNKYDYSKVVYDGNKKSIIIICPRHGGFEQLPNDHLDGHGCPFCKEWKLETTVAEILRINNVNFIRQAHFKWLSRQSLDFYLPDYNVGIECQGIQHFEPRSFTKHRNRQDSHKSFNDAQNRDKKKFQKCKENGVRLLYFSDLKKYRKMFGVEVMNDKELTELITEWQG